MQVTQAQFRAALLDVDAPIPQGLLDGGGAPAGARYNVYRNNVTVSLIEAMKVAFPTVRSLLGPQNFDSLMPAFVRAHPPTSPLMMHYGTDFPAFLSEVKALEHLGYLADAARLDLAMRASYHAADAAPFDPSVLQQPPDALAGLRLQLAPATRLLRARWPIYDLWLRTKDATAPKPRATGQAVLITRPTFDPAPLLLPAGAATFLLALETHPLGSAIETAQAAISDFDFAATLTLLLSNSALTQ